ncbi:GntR family transcriptional regulator [Parabacteroides pacaensis]|uniref:GntR family transcriptional regulator n=1 Tax=Parabacteroides pacaensis TaxID=2086575 RepID=UPI000D0FE9A9|nr:GntR family transcriptional regulator [Parabacteroides pacaensis]
MNYSANQSIFIQIADRICDRILSGEYLPEARIPSVREMAIDMEVNPNTVMRSYERLQNSRIIYNKRGIGYFTSSDAKDKIIEIRHRDFMKEVLPAVFNEMSLLGISIKEVTDAYTNFLSTKKQNEL